MMSCNVRAGVPGAPRVRVLVLACFICRQPLRFIEVRVCVAWGMRGASLPLSVRQYATAVMLRGFGTKCCRRDWPLVATCHKHQRLSCVCVCVCVCVCLYFPACQLRPARLNPPALSPLLRLPSPPFPLRHFEFLNCFPVMGENSHFESAVG
jgi:hypothetical protein